MDDLPDRVRAHVEAALGSGASSASVSFLGLEPIEVLRFGPDGDGITRYVTVGMSRAPMHDPGAPQRTGPGPRAELVLTLRGRRDSVLRRLAAVAASPMVDGLVVDSGAGVDLGEPLWDGAPFTAVLVGLPGGLLADLPVPEDAPVRFHPLLPMTPSEAAWKRVHGASALEQAWLRAGTDLRDPLRPGVRLPSGFDA